MLSKVWFYSDNPWTKRRISDVRESEYSVLWSLCRSINHVWLSCFSLTNRLTKCCFVILTNVSKFQLRRSQFDSWFMNHEPLFRTLRWFEEFLWNKAILLNCWQLHRKVRNHLYMNNSKVFSVFCPQIHGQTDVYIHPSIPPDIQSQFSTISRGRKFPPGGYGSFLERSSLLSIVKFWNTNLTVISHSTYLLGHDQLSWGIS